MILALRCGCVSHAAWPDDGVASSGMLRQQDQLGVISLGSWMTASDAGGGGDGGGGGGAWLLATTKELANRTHVPYFFARAPKSRQSHCANPSLRSTNMAGFTFANAPRMFANILSSAGYIATLSRIKYYANEWMNEWTNIGSAFLSFLREERLSCDVTLLREKNHDANIVKVASNNRHLLTIEFFSW